jgi:hypothetical protein
MTGFLEFSIPLSRVKDLVNSNVLVRKIKGEVGPMKF